MSKNPYMDKGSISLEASLVIPGFLVFLYVIYLNVMAYRVDLIYQEAAYSAINEFSLVSTFLNDEEYLEDVSWLELELKLENLTKGYINSQWLKLRHNHWVEKNLDKNIKDFFIKSNTSSIKRIDSTLVYEYSYKGPNVLGEKEYRYILQVPYWGGLSLDSLSFESSEREEESSGIWEEDSFTRGRYFRENSGANLPSNYPTIARFENGTAYSIKSIDLTAPSYQSAYNLSRRISSYARQLRDFKGTNSWGRDNITIHENEIRTRVLLLIIPENSSMEAKSILQEEKLHWRFNGIEIRIEENGISQMYE